MPEKLQTLLPILIALVALVVRWWKKAQETTQREQQERRFSKPDSTGRPRPGAPALPATSFEELLKQMTAENRAGQSVPPPPAPTVNKPTERPRPSEAARPLRRAEPAPSRPASTEVPAPQRPASAPPAVRPTDRQLQPAARESQRVLRAPNATETRRHVTDLLRNPADIRAAFVLSEILKRKF